MKDFTSFDAWDIAETVQSQYATSKRMRAVIDAFWQAINPKSDIDLLYRKLVNPRTAEGYGLDVWGRIVAIGRSYLAAEDTNSYFGFDPPEGVKNDRLGTFNVTPFYKKIMGKVRMADTMFRTYVFLKALINISNSSLAGLNQMVKLLFPDADIQILHTGTMVLRVLVLSPLSESDKAALDNLPWLPAGVGLEMYQVITPTFGFAGATELHNSYNGPFATSGIT
ncbi:DUF2612 domain-containing protein, partial [Enterococcus innesii]|uniref:DUF2612 domain-containing protein n=1 Tax=Enterococcus innesii TaxID=2839759 RepID=UPI003DA26707